MGAQLGNDGDMSDINMTPLIDIVLVVLIIMMVNIPIQIEEMDLKLPNTKRDDSPQTKQEQLVIKLYADGTLALNTWAMKEDDLRDELNRRIRNTVDKRVFVDAHADVEYGLVVDMVDLAREQGAAVVGLAKLKEQGPSAPTGVYQGAGLARGIHLGNPLLAKMEGALLTESQADSAMQALKGSIEACYLQRLAARPDLTGTYQVLANVGPSGELLDPPEITADSVNDLELRDCVKPLLPNLKFPPVGSQKTAAIRFPILFSPG